MRSFDRFQRRAWLSRIFRSTNRSTIYIYTDCQLEPACQLNPSITSNRLTRPYRNVLLTIALIRYIIRFHKLPFCIHAFTILRFNRSIESSVRGIDGASLFCYWYLRRSSALRRGYKSNNMAVWRSFSRSSRCKKMLEERNHSGKIISR